MEKLNTFTTDALSKLKCEEDNLNIAMIEIQKIFREILKNHNILISGRVKSPESLKGKILKNSSHIKFVSGSELISDLNDIIGVRVICLLHSYEDYVWNYLQENFTVTKLEGLDYLVFEDILWLKKIQLPVPQKNGHPIYKIHGHYKKSEVTFNFELQIKSLVHMLWGEIEHMLFYKNYEYLLENDTYGYIMDTLYNSLISIDSQLESIKKQMLGKDESIIFSELKRMLAKILYESVNPTIDQLFECKFDLRECYDSVIEVTLHKNYIFDYKHCLEKMDVVISQIRRIQLDKLSSDIPCYIYSKEQHDNESHAAMSQIISDNMKNNYSWRLFVFLAGETCALQGDNDIIGAISKYFFKLYSYDEDLDEIDKKKHKIVISVNDSYILKLIEKFHHFWLIKNSTHIYEYIIKIMRLISKIVIDDCENIDTASKLMVNVLFINTCLDFSEEVPLFILEEIYRDAENDVWAPEIFKNHEFKKLIDNFDKNQADSIVKLKEIINSGEVWDE